MKYLCSSSKIFLCCHFLYYIQSCIINPVQNCRNTKIPAQTLLSLVILQSYLLYKAPEKPFFPISIADDTPFGKHLIQNFNHLHSSSRLFSVMNSKYWLVSHPISIHKINSGSVNREKRWWWKLWWELLNRVSSRGLYDCDVLWQANAIMENNLQFSAPHDDNRQQNSPLSNEGF